MDVMAADSAPVMPSSEKCSQRARRSGETSGWNRPGWMASRSHLDDDSEAAARSACASSDAMISDRARIVREKRAAGNPAEGRRGDTSNLTHAQHRTCNKQGKVRINGAKVCVECVRVEVRTQDGVNANLRK